MEYFYWLLSFAVGLILGGGVIWLLLRARVQQAYHRAKAEFGPEKIATLEERMLNREQQIQELKDAQEKQKLERESQFVEQLRIREDLKAQLAESQTKLDEERKITTEKIGLLNEAQQQLSDAFKALSAEALRSNNESFLTLANTALAQFQEGARGDLERRQQAIQELVNPVKETLDKFDTKLQDLEIARVGAYTSLMQQVESLIDAQKELRRETSTLAVALRAPNVRGRWGEIQLKRVVEMAGMLDHCDFYEQEGVTTEVGRLRPDLLVRLPGQKTIIIDAKAPLEAYLDSLQATDESTRKVKLQDHARQIRTHITALSKKAYWEQFQPTPEFVVLFLPGEVFFSAALEQDPSLIEAGIDQNIILATPTTLIALLRAIVYGWRQENIEQSAKQIGNLGGELYKRISTMGAHWVKLGKSLGSSIDAYNKAVGSLESQVLPSARRFKAFDVIAIHDDIAELTEIELTPRRLHAPDVVASLNGDEE